VKLVSAPPSNPSHPRVSPLLFFSPVYFIITAKAARALVVERATVESEATAAAPGGFWNYVTRTTTTVEITG